MESTAQRSVQELALRLALDGFESGRWLLVEADGTLERVGDGVARVIERPAPAPGVPAAAVLGPIGEPLPEGVARCGPEGEGPALEATFAPVDPVAADDVRAELERYVSTLGAPAARPAVRSLLAGVAGREATTGASDRVATLVVLRRIDAAFPAPAPVEPPAELVALAPVLDELAALRGEVDAVRAREAGPTEETLSALRRDVRAALDEADAARREAEGLRDELETARSELQRHVDELGEAVRAAMLVSEDARRETRRAIDDLEAARAEAARPAPEPVEDAGAVVRAERVVEIWRQMIAHRPPEAAPSAAEVRPRPDRRPEHRERPALAGFDDVATPMAHVTLDGRFLRLNPAFARLVGYREDEFTKARWPSLLDRAAYEHQLERRIALIAGELDRAPLDASYLGGDGLLVTVRGHAELVRDPSGEPSHLLLVGEDRHTL